jgi:chorismate mutase
LAAVLTNAPEITDSSEIEALRENLRKQINEAWNTRDAVTQDLVYHVGVSKDGKIVGYKAVNQAALTNTNKTPLITLLDFPAQGGSRSPSEPIAEYKVVFTPSGVAEVAPWKEAMATPISKNGGTEITDNARLEQLLEKLQDQFYDNSKDLKPTYESELVYRVRVNEDGSIADYKPDNPPAYNYVQETPFRTLGKPADEGGGTLNSPHAIFKVVLKPGGAAEISPWRGWQPE